MSQVQGEEDFPMLARYVGSRTQLVAIGVRRQDGFKYRSLSLQAESKRFQNEHRPQAGTSRGDEPIDV